MAHKVICTICKQEFDRDKIPAILVKTRRYAHATCVLSQDNIAEELKSAAEQVIKQQEQIEEKARIEKEQTQAKITKDEQDLKILESYIMKLFKIDYVYPRMRKQINQYHEQNSYSYNDIYKALSYFYDVKKNSIEKANYSLGIVPYIYEEAKTYWIRLWKMQQINQAKPIEQFKELPPKIISIYEPSPQQFKRTRNKLFAFLDEEET